MNINAAESETRKFHEHIKRKEECNAAKVSDKDRANTDPNFVSITFDLQSVLQIPSSDVSLMYYSRKLCAYNFTIYEAASPNNAFCFCWTEINGKRGSSEIGTCLSQYLRNLPSNVKEISMFSDTCGGQNRNQHIAALLMHIVQETEIEVIEQKFLESGHSYMEVDSMHSAIERAKKFIPVYTMQDWISIFKVARSNRLRNKNSQGYQVLELKFDDFLDLRSLSKKFKNKSRNTEKEKVNWLLVKCFKYTKANPNILQYRYDHTSEYKSIQLYGVGRPASKGNITNLYQSNLPISNEKKKDLVTLCRKMVIPVEFHSWYESLPASINI